MPNKFLLVEKHTGSYLAIDQIAIKTTYERLHHRPFDGVCAGVVAGFLERMFGYAQSNPQFFSKPAFKNCFLPSPARCILLQADYERIEDYFPIFIRDYLHFPTSDAKEKGFKNIPEILNKIDPESGTNDIILMNIIFKLEIGGHIYHQDHKICLLKFNNQYMFCEPNYGVAVFSRLDDLKTWFVDEMSNGSLNHFMKPVNKSMIVADNKEHPTGLQQGLLSVESVYFELFSKPIPQAGHSLDEEQFKPRL